MADTQVRIPTHLHNSMKNIAEGNNESIRSVYEKALRLYIEKEAQEELLRESNLEYIINNRISKTEELIIKSVERLASLEARVGIDNSMSLIGTMILMEKLFKMDRKIIQDDLRKQGALYFSTAIKEDKDKKKMEK